MRLSLTLLLVGCTWLSLSGLGRADSKAKAPPGYAEAVAQGLVELEANNFPEAREEFLRAHALYPNARTLRGLGMVEFELRHYAESVRFLEESLASSVKPLTGNLRSETEALLARAKRYLGELHLEIEPQVERVLIDGATLDVPPDGVFQLEVGEHTVEIRADGRSPERRAFRVEGGERVNLHVALGLLPTHAEGPVANAAQPPPVSAVRQDKPGYKKWWVWTTVAVVVAGGATAAAILLTRDKDSDPQAVTGPNTVGVSLQTLRGL